MAMQFAITQSWRLLDMVPDHSPAAAQQRALDVNTELCGVIGKSSMWQDSFCIKHMC
jgi:hypothetical protein